MKDKIHWKADKAAPALFSCQKNYNNFFGQLIGESMNLEVLLGRGYDAPSRQVLTSVLIRREGDLLLFDCGEAQISLRKLNLNGKRSLQYLFRTLMQIM